MATAKRISATELTSLADVFRYEDASKDEDIASYLVSRDRYASDRDSRTVIIYGPAGCGKTALLVDIAQHFRTKEKRRTCRTQFRSLERLSDQIRYQNGGQSGIDAARYVVDVWVLMELASEFHAKLITRKSDKTVRDAVVKLGFTEGDLIERAASWVKDNVDGLLTALGTIFAVDPGTAKASGKVASSILADKDLGVATRISRASAAAAQHRLMKSLVFQIDDFDSGFSGVPELAQLLEEYLRALYDVTAGGTVAPYAVAVSSAIFQYRRREGLPLKFARKSIFVQPWEAEELWLLLQKRFERALGKARAKSVASQFGINFGEAPEVSWAFEGNDAPNPLGALPRPRSFVLLWQDILKRPIRKALPSSSVWDSHLQIAVMEAEAYLAARYQEITPLLRELKACKSGNVDRTSFNDIRKSAINAAPRGALWIGARIEDLMDDFAAAGVLAANPAGNGEYRIRKKLLPTTG